MARPKTKPAPAALAPESLLAWADAAGEALGRGLARGLSAGLAAGGLWPTPRRRGRPPKLVLPGTVAPEKRCTVEGCIRQARSKGLCPAHYQAERRLRLAKG